MNFFHMGDMHLTEGVKHWALLKSRFRLGENSNLHAQLYHLRYKALYIYRATIRAYDTWLADAPDFPSNTESFDGRLRFDTTFGSSLLLVAGASLRHSFLEAEHVIPQRPSEFRGAGFFQLQWTPREDLQLTGGLRLDLNSKTSTALSPRLVAVYGPAEMQTLRLGYGIAFRKPSLYESQIHFEVSDYNPAMREIVDLAATQFGNPALDNQQVHSLEAGWRGRFMDDRLHCFADLFINLYQDTIFFEVDIRERLGAPDMTNSTFMFQNQGDDIYALGGEIELVWHPDPAWRFSGSAAYRWVANLETGRAEPTEPHLRLGLTGRYLPETGWLVDLSLHSVSAYQMPLLDPGNLLLPPKLSDQGENLLMFARLGYRLEVRQRLQLEAGLAARIPLGNPFREYPGIVESRFLKDQDPAAFGGELLRRRVVLYLRSTF
jgi:outer membrane receptor protein involved in Fe transport